MYVYLHFDFDLIFSLYFIYAFTQFMSIHVQFTYVYPQKNLFSVKNINFVMLNNRFTRHGS